MSVAAQTLRPPSRTLMFLEGERSMNWALSSGPYRFSVSHRRAMGTRYWYARPGRIRRFDPPLRGFLRNRGYAVSGWRQGRNLGLRHGVQRAMVDLVQELNDSHGRKVSLVGWSLGGLYARQLAKMMPARVRSVITLGSPFAAGPKATNAWRVYEMASGRVPTKRTRSSAGRLRARLRCRPPQSSAAPTASAPGRAAGRRTPRYPKASRSKAAIAAWAIILPPSMRWPSVSRKRKANGRRSIAAAGAASSIPIRIGKPRARVL